MHDVNFHFIANAASDDDLDDLRSMEWDAGARACVIHTWTWPAYCRLKMCGMNVTLGYHLKRNAVNLIHGQVARRQLDAKDLRSYFIVGIRADFRPFPYGHFEVVQNMKTAGGGRIYMPLFPQAGLVPRDSSRNIVQNICYVGQPENSANANKLADNLAAIGCRLIFKGMDEWHDLSDVDILLGIRSFSRKTYENKPPTKLFNAWLAEIPFIGGYDSAYEQVGEPGRNYFRISTPDELINAIRMLKEDENLYRRTVAEGRLAGTHYSAGEIAVRWKSFLEEQVAPDYWRWEGSSLRSHLEGKWNSTLFFTKERLFISGLKKFRKMLRSE